jgi:hypothetical protein
MTVGGAAELQSTSANRVAVRCEASVYHTLVRLPFQPHYTISGVWGKEGRAVSVQSLFCYDPSEGQEAEGGAEDGSAIPNPVR